MEVADTFDLRKEEERAAGEAAETLEDEQETNGDALEGAERAREEKRAARGIEREMGRKDTILAEDLDIYGEIDEEEKREQENSYEEEERSMLDINVSKTMTSLLV
jgi:hypothetical protein